MPDQDRSAELQRLLGTLEPTPVPGTYVFATVPAGVAVDPRIVMASIREAEGLSVVVTETDAIRLGLAFTFRAAWITLSVQSDLAAVGLTAAFATALSQAGISCNVVAGTHHDHLFVPIDQADAAMAILRDLQHRSTSGRPKPGRSY